MLQLIPLLLFAQPMLSVPDRVILRDPQNAATPAMTGWVLLPPKVPDCRTDQEEQIALEQRRNGDPEMCDPKTKLVTRARR